MPLIMIRAKLAITSASYTVLARPGQQRVHARGSHVGWGAPWGMVEASLWCPGLVLASKCEMVGMRSMTMRGVHMRWAQTPC